MSRSDLGLVPARGKPKKRPGSSRRGGDNSNQAQACSALHLDGLSYVELPTGMVKGLSQATVEGWMKWDRLDALGDLFDFGRKRTEIWVSPGWRASRHDTSRLTAQTILMLTNRTGIVVARRPSD